MKRATIVVLPTSVVQSTMFRLVLDLEHCWSWIVSLVALPLLPAVRMQVSFAINTINAGGALNLYIQPPTTTIASADKRNANCQMLSQLPFSAGTLIRAILE